MLDNRTKQVLFAVIQCYINSPGPVGSRVVTKKFSFGLSPATIRNIMSDLEEMGFLQQPHTSAGRVPTDTGYRFFVDHLQSEAQQADKELISELDRKFSILKKDINNFLDDASRMLSSLSHYIGITTSPNTGMTTLNRIELHRYRNDKLAVILFTDEGIISNKIISISRDISQSDLNRFADYINSNFSGHSLDEIRSRVVREATDDKILCDRLISQAMDLCKDIFYNVPGDIFISGLSEVIDLPDFCDISRIRELLRTIEDKHAIIKLLDKFSEIDGTQIFIGSENPFNGMKNFSLVLSTYKEGNRPIGAIGIIGPTRMNYLKAISIVDTTADYITNILSNR